MYNNKKSIKDENYAKKKEVKIFTNRRYHNQLVNHMRKDHISTLVSNRFLTKSVAVVLFFNSKRTSLSLPTALTNANAASSDTGNHLYKYT
jgi:hypothetical protein